MKKLYIIANWKSHKTTQEAKQWLDEIASHTFPNVSEKEIIVCASFTLLPFMKSYIDTLRIPISLGAQNISPFEEGAHTGEINGKQISEFAQYVLIGHSERRREFREDDILIQKKVEMARSNGIQPIVCVLDETTKIPEGVNIVAYELASAIGTGTPDTPESAERVASIIKKSLSSVTATLYGASVTPENAKSFTDCPSIDGVLVGGASLDAQQFIHIINNS